MTKVRRTFNVPDMSGVMWTATCEETDETLQCGDYVTLLQSVAKQALQTWTIYPTIPFEPLSVDEEIALALKRHEERMAKFPSEVRRLLP